MPFLGAGGNTRTYVHVALISNMAAKVWYMYVF